MCFGGAFGGELWGSCSVSNLCDYCCRQIRSQRTRWTWQNVPRHNLCRPKQRRTLTTIRRINFEHSEPSILHFRKKLLRLFCVRKLVKLLDVFNSQLARINEHDVKNDVPSLEIRDVDALNFFQHKR